MHIGTTEENSRIVQTRLVPDTFQACLDKYFLVMAGKDELLKHYISNPLLLGTHGQAASAGKTNPL